MTSSTSPRIIGILPFFALLVSTVLAALLNPFENQAFNPPNLLFALNTIFVTGTGVFIAAISAYSYLKTGYLNMLLLGGATLAGGLASLVGGYGANIAANYGVTTHNVGMLLSSLLQVLSAVITLLHARAGKSLKGNAHLLTITYSAIAIFFAVWTALTFSNLTPIFFAPGGPTLLRQAVLGLTIGFFTLSGLLFFHQYVRSRAIGLYWYSIALGLFAIGMLGIVFQMRNADVFVWIGRLAQYAGGFYFLLAFLSLRHGAGPSGLSERWVEAFSSDRRQLAALFANMLNGFSYNRIILDNKGMPVNFVYLEVNDAFEQITGLSRDRVVGKKVTEVFPVVKEGLSRLIATFGQVAISGNPELFEYYFSPIKKWLTISTYSPRKDYFIVIFEDITERKKAEEALLQAQTKLREYTTNLERLVEERTRQLRESERMATIGQTAGMVGHDIRNPLQSILGDLYLLKCEVENIADSESKQSALDMIGNINENINYINKIVADLQDYARKTEPKNEVVNLEDAIQRIFESISIPENIQTSYYTEPNLKLKVDPTYIRRIITNLTTNAIQAMPNGGKLTINATRHINDKSVQIIVADTGEGILKAHQEKVFKPLFTTKAKGQGFGLAVVKKFVEELGGTIRFESEEGQGTKFTINLPQNY